MRVFTFTITLLLVAATSVYSSDVKLAIFADSLASNCYVELNESNEIFKAYLKKPLPLIFTKSFSLVNMMEKWRYRLRL